MDNKHIKKCSMVLLFKGMKINTAKILQYTCHKAKNIKRLIIPNLGKDLEQLGFSLFYIINGNVTWHNHFGKLFGSIY